MKVRDSGMPEEEYWQSLLDVTLTLDRFHIGRYSRVAEMGCGYGTFSVPIARSISGTLYTFDIESKMVDLTKQKLLGLPARCELRDVVECGFGVEADAALLFNILHCENPVRLLQWAALAAPEVLVTHWIYGPTPRGPSLDIRPRPEQIAQWAQQAGLRAADAFDLPPWHFGMRLVRHDPADVSPLLRR